MTTRLYYRDATLLEFDAMVVDHAGDPTRVVLDRTAFYPTSGGQPHDTGILGNAEVTDVIDEESRIVHVLSAAVPLGAVRGVIDAPRRRDHVQQHSAQHLLSALAGDRYGWETTSVHFGAEHSTIEFATGAPSDQQLADLERAANAIVAAAHPVVVTFEDAVAADAAGLRKPSGRTGELRVITIEGVDRSACGGTHVSRTSEIGPVLLLDVEKVRGHARVGFLAGARVLSRVRSTDATLAALAASFGCAANQVADVAAARQVELKGVRDQLAAMEQEVADARVRALCAGVAADADGIRRIMHRATDESAALLRLMAQAIAPLERVLFAAVGTAPAAIYFATSSDSAIDAGATLKPALAAAGGRGGGSPRVAQGTAPTAAALEAIAGALLAVP